MDCSGFKDKLSYSVRGTMALSTITIRRCSDGMFKSLITSAGVVGSETSSVSLPLTTSRSFGKCSLSDAATLTFMFN